MGKPLYEIDVNESATDAKPSKTQTQSNATNDTKPAKPTATRTPLIKFIGKRSAKKITIPSPKNIPTSSPSTTTNKPTKPQTGVDFYTLKGGAWFGRPKLSQKEIEAIESGGIF